MRKSVLNLLQKRLSRDRKKWRKKFVVMVGVGISGILYSLLQLFSQPLVRQRVLNSEIALRFSGYGNLACKTNIGRIATIIYGLIGIPLMLFVLKVFGELSFKWVQKIRYNLRRCGRKCIWKKLKRSSTIETVASDEMLETCEDSVSLITTFV